MDHIELVLYALSYGCIFFLFVAPFAFLLWAGFRAIKQHEKELSNLWRGYFTAGSGEG